MQPLFYTKGIPGQGNWYALGKKKKKTTCFKESQLLTITF